MRVLPVMAVALVTLITACGGGGGSGSDSTSSKRAIQTETQQRAEAMLLLLSNLPDGWRASPSKDTGSGEKLRKCIGTDYSALTITGEASSKDFAYEDSAELLTERSISQKTRLSRP